MTQCKRRGSSAKRLRRRAVEFDFDGGRLTSDAGLLLLRQVDSKLGLIDAVNDAIPDLRSPERITHQQREMIAQRIFAIAAGYEDENDLLRIADTRPDQVGQVVTEFHSRETPLSIDRLFTELYEQYDQRFVYAAPKLSKTTRRKEWASVSPVVSDSRFIELELEARVEEAEVKPATTGS